MKKQVWRPGLSTLLVLPGPWVLISTLVMFAALKNSEMWIAFYFSLGMALIMVVWVLAFAVEVDKERLSYSSLFGRKRVVALNQIQSVKLEIADAGFRNMFLPLIRLRIVPKPESVEKDFHINVKVLKRGAGAQIADAISSSATMTEQNSA